MIVLLTDFGTRDPYVASMKGVIASRTDVPVADLSHEIAPHDVFEGAWFLRTAVRWWPARTIFVAVVDPGVGSDRRILAALEGKRIFLAPDNGLLTFIAADRIWSVENESLFLRDGSTTFHGRDRFAPVAAAIANGTALDVLGPRVGEIVRLDYEEAAYGDELVRGTIVSVDRFGNAITDVERARVPFPSMELRVGTAVIRRMATTYSGEGAFLITGSSGTIEISVAEGSAAALLHLRRGDKVEIRRS
jgi:S-adenosylmethionine hydrolase